uniref:Uncharacterized protein n=1 Tax=Arundo donax TaxID=35708 RepID=A0A0A9EU98_ARUDO
MASPFAASPPMTLAVSHQYLDYRNSHNTPAQT